MNIENNVVVGKDFSGKVFTNNDLTNAKLFRCNFTRAKFINCDLSGTDFTGSNLDKTDFIWCKSTRLALNDTSMNNVTILFCIFAGVAWCESTTGNIRIENSLFPEAWAIDSDIVNKIKESV